MDKVVDKTAAFLLLQFKQFKYGATTMMMSTTTRRRMLLGDIEEKERERERERES